MTKKTFWVIATALVLSLTSMAAVYAGTNYSCHDESTCTNNASCEGDSSYISGCSVQCLNATSKPGVYVLGSSANCAVSTTRGPYTRSPSPN